jgi:Ser/Thr protein kinase RdoA (MazF antagonist)
LYRELLLHLERESFPASPRFLGLDEEDREIFTYIEGTVPPGPQLYDDAQLAGVAVLLRNYHDATISFAGRDDGSEVICHNDFCPSNIVFRDGQPVAIIDFDNAAPGPRMRDLGSAVPTFLHLGHPEYGIQEQLRRLRLFADSYGLTRTQMPDLAAYVTTYLAHTANRAPRVGHQAWGEWAALTRDWFLTHVFESLVQTGRRPLTAARAALPSAPASAPDTGDVDPEWTRLMGF